MSKKISIALVALCVLAFALSSVFTLTGCGTMYQSNPGTKEQMAGTYELTTYTQKDENGNEVDRIEQLKVKAYMVVREDGHGYYAYKDKDTPFWYDSTIITFNHDYDQPELYDSIRFSTGIGHLYINQQKPGCGYEPPMGFNANNNTFNYFIPDYKPTMKGVVPSYYTNVVYTKVSNDTNLNKIASEFNKTLKPLAKYEVKNLDGALIFHAGMPNHEIDATVTNDEYGKYKYYVVDFNALYETATIYYEEIAGGGPKVLENVPIEITIVEPSDKNYNQNQVIIKFFGKDYHATLDSNKVPPRYLNYTVWSEPDEYGSLSEIYNNWFEKYNNYDNKTIDQIVQEQLEIYNNSLE